MPRGTIEQWSERQEALRRTVEKRSKALAQIKRKIAQEQARLDTERYAALGRAVEADLGLETAEEWQEWFAMQGLPTGPRYAQHVNGNAGVG